MAKDLAHSRANILPISITDLLPEPCGTATVNQGADGRPDSLF